MKHELEIKIQACLDGELSALEMKEMSEFIRRDAEAQQLYDALRLVKKVVAENEPEYRLPESREFYWSKIEREIRKGSLADAPEVARLGWRNWWVRCAGAVAGLALLSIIAVSSLRFTNGSNRGPQEIELPDDINAITFHSESANMTVVWVQQREDTN